MKKTVSVFLTVIMLFSALMLPVSAAGEYTNGQVKFSIPDVLIQDTEWAGENGYLDYWHTEDYGFEFCLWRENITVAIHPTDKEGSFICHDIRWETDYEATRNGAVDTVINGHEFVDDNIEVRYDGKSVILHQYIFNDGESYAGKEYYYMTFFIHDESYSGYVDEIMNSFDATYLFYVEEWSEFIWTGIFVLVIGTVLVVKKIKRKKEK